MKAGMTELDLVIGEPSLQLRLPFEAQPPSPQFKQAGTQPQSAFRGVSGVCCLSDSLRALKGAEMAPASERRHGSLKEKRVATRKSFPQCLFQASCRPFHTDIRVLSIWDLCLRLYLRRGALVQARPKHTN